MTKEHRLMGQRTFRLNRMAAVALAVATAFGGAAAFGAGTATAAVTGTTLAAPATTPAVFPGQSAQAGGDLVLTVPNTFAPSATIAGFPDSISLQVATPSGAGTCAPATNTIGFAATPTLVVTAGGANDPADTAPTFTEALSTPVTEPPACAGTNDTLTLTVTNLATGTAGDTWT